MSKYYIVECFTLKQITQEYVNEGLEWCKKHCVCLITSPLIFPNCTVLLHHNRDTIFYIEVETLEDN